MAQSGRPKWSDQERLSIPGPIWLCTNNPRYDAMIIQNQAREDQDEGHEDCSNAQLLVPS